MVIKKIYFLLLIIAPIFIFLFKEQYLYAGIWIGIGGIIIFLETTKIGRKLKDLIF